MFLRSLESLLQNTLAYDVQLQLLLQFDTHQTPMSHTHSQKRLMSADDRLLHIDTTLSMLVWLRLTCTCCSLLLQPDKQCGSTHI